MHNDDDLWRQIHEKSPEGFTLLECVRDEHNKIVDFIWKYINEAGEKISRLKKEEIIGKRLLELSKRALDSGIYAEYIEVVEKDNTLIKDIYMPDDDRWYKIIAVKVNDGVAVTFSDISVQKMLEHELRSNETYLRNITESIPQLVWITRPDGYHEYFNQQWYAFTGMTPKECLGEGRSKAYHPADEKKTWKMWQQSLKTGAPYEVENRLRNGKTGEYRWFLGRAKPIRNEEGEIIKWFGTCTDIHTQKVTIEAQQFLAEASKLLSSSLNYRKVLPKVAKLAVPHIADWVSIELYDGKNVEAVAIAHIDPAKVKWARKLRKERPVDMHENAGLPYVLKSGESVLYPLITEEMIRAAAKTEKEIELIREIGFTSVMIVPISVENKTIGAVQFVSTDSKRQFNEVDLHMAQELAGRISLSMQNAMLYEELGQRESMFQALYDSNIIGVIYAKTNGEVHEANDAFFSMIGYTRDDFSKHRIRWDLITPKEYREIDEKKIQELIQTGVAKPFEKEYIRKDGSQVPVIVGVALLDKKSNSCVAFILDITERKKLEARKDEFLGIASHELKTPLTSIKGYVQILERIIQEMGDDKARLLVNKTNTYIDKLNSLIVDLLDVSKIQAGKLQFTLERFDLAKLVKESVIGIQPTTSHKLVLKSTFPAPIEGDRHRLEQVMANLITNAIKYSPMGKEVIISVEKKGSNVQVNVQDFGIGIEEQYQRLLFQRFYRVEASSRQFSGLGIGLYISSEIITRHGGKIWLESMPGVGSTFHFTLPLRKEE